MSKTTSIKTVIIMAIIAIVFLLLEMQAVHQGKLMLAKSLGLGWFIVCIWILMQVMEVYTPKNRSKLKKPKICSYEQYYRFYNN